MNTNYDILVIGGGAAGFFTACNAAEGLPEARIGILERGSDVLGKVKVSGGGRCNVTHAEFIPNELAKRYPRGEKELLGPFHSFMTGDTMEWFESRGVPLKIEDDGRVFPVSDDSQTIIDCLLKEARTHHIEVLTNQSVKDISIGAPGFHIITSKNTFHAKKLVICTGSNSKIWQLLEKLGHTIIPPVPSLFTFNIEDPRIDGLAGVATSVHVEVKLDEKNPELSSNGPLLITHWGMSGPAILKLSAWGARELAKVDYQFGIRINWLEHISFEEAENQLKVFTNQLGKKTLMKYPQFGLPKRLWERLSGYVGIAPEQTWAELTKKDRYALAQELTHSVFQVNGKSTFKEEFVTAGGVNLKEVNFKTFESKVVPGMYFAGEVLNIDAITGGFNFQNAWTGGYMVAKELAAFRL